MTHPVIAIDGPAGAGKSTVARLVAVKLGFLYVDTGAMYRALTLKALQTGKDLADETALAHMAANTSLALLVDNGAYRVLLDGCDVSDDIRTEQVSENCHYLASARGVRDVLWNLQRAMRVSQPLVMEGRDIGSVVFPDAELKVFLDASIEERARRRFRQLEQQGKNPDFSHILRAIATRDAHDHNRAIAPLIRLPDAVSIDSTKMTIEEVVAMIAQLAHERGLTDLRHDAR